jgi:GMP synthase (glutamine-hydrolysing)
LPADKIRAMKPDGIIFTGGPKSVFEEKAPKCDPEVFGLGIPILGICYGQQLMGQMLAGRWDRREARIRENRNFPSVLRFV